MTPEQRRKWVGSMGARTEWLNLRAEPAIEPQWDIVDAHCHFWTERDVPDPAHPAETLRTSRYMPDSFLRDASGGHKLTDFIYIECGSGYDLGAQAHLMPVGETRFAAALAGQFSADKTGPQLAGITAHADLCSPNLHEVLKAHLSEGNGLVRAIRHSGARLEDPDARLLAGAAPADLYARESFRQGVALLGEYGLAFEAFQFHFQLGDLAELIAATPGTVFIINHLGAPIGFGRGGQQDDAIFPVWAEAMANLSRFANVVVKLGGMASPVTGYDGSLRELPPSSEEFVAERGRYFHHAIELFGADRCMFESNFPVDSVSISYTTLWNAYKRMAADYSTAERQALLAGTARAIYRLDEAASGSTYFKASMSN